MPSTPKEVLAATTGATQSSAFNIVTAVTVTTTTLAGAETATIQIGHQQTQGADVTWQDLYREGTLQALSATNNAVTVLGPGYFRVDKDATVSATSISIWT